MTVLPAMTTVEFQFGIGREFVVTFVTAVWAATESQESPAILMLRSCSAFPLKSSDLEHCTGVLPGSICVGRSTTVSNRLEHIYDIGDVGERMRRRLRPVRPAVPEWRVQCGELVGEGGAGSLDCLQGGVSEPQRVVGEVDDVARGG